MCTLSSDAHLADLREALSPVVSCPCTRKRGGRASLGTRQGAYNTDQPPKGTTGPDNILGAGWPILAGSPPLGPHYPVVEQTTHDNRLPVTTTSAQAR